MIQRGLVLLSLAVILLSSGCEVDPYCVNCSDGQDAEPDSGDGGNDGGDADADGDGDGDGDADGDADADADGCNPEADEICNGEDDDCDGEVDEDFDLNTDARHCGRCNNPCRFDHAFSECVEGSCVVEACETCFHDVDDDVTTGCEHACCETESPTVEGSCESGDCCDGLDNDCDGETDEDHDTSNDPLNCGGCSAGCVEGEPCPFRCDYILGIGACVDGVCELSGCVEGHYDVNGDPDDGCEYACTPNPDTGGVEQCNSRDDDCDGEVDESFDGMGDVCGSDEGACETGVLSCDRGAEVCEGEVSPTEDLCDGLDNDCDGETDEDDSRLGGGCSTDMGECVRGTYGCLDGSLVCQGGVDPTVETCNGLDDNCNGVVDDGIADEGSCGTDEGECTAGTRVCLGGRFVCDGSMGPRLEDCNGLDDDCDGEVDEELVRDCSNECGIGEESCTGGAWGDCTAPVSSEEVCDGADNDCDGAIDEADEGGPLTRSCTEGSCSGVETCIGPSTWSTCDASSEPETCNGVDDDCDGETDEDFVLATDPRNCGECGHACQDEFPNAVVSCEGGACVQVVCQTGFYDIDPDDAGCEYACTFTGAEDCDGEDNDCNGEVDDWTPPPRFCGSFGVCVDLAVTCEGSPPTATCNYTAEYEETETLCDGVDNDCDGLVDESHQVGDSYACTDDALGRCTGRGHQECDPSNPSGPPICVIDVPGEEPTVEMCNNIDDDCDGVVDNGIAVENTNSIDVIADVDLNDDGFLAGDEVAWTYSMFQYEASHPDATDADLGQNWGWACSSAGVQPWVAVSWRDAQDACCGLNTGRACAYQTALVSGGETMTVPEGWALCMAPDWEVGCQAGSHLTDPTLADAPWVYPYGSDLYDATACNGADVNPDQVATTGSTGSCFGGGDIWSGDHYDMSGNVHEWTWTGWFVCGCDEDPTDCDTGCECDPDCECTCGMGSRCQQGCACDPDCNTFYEYRGGSFRSVEQSMTCQWDFNVGADRSDDPDGATEPDPGMALENLGFRCCWYPTL